MQWTKAVGAPVAALVVGLGGAVWVSHALPKGGDASIGVITPAPTVDPNHLHVEVVSVDRVASHILPGAEHPLVVTISVADPAGNSDRTSWGTDTAQFQLFSPLHVGVKPTVNASAKTCPWWSADLQPGGTITEPLCFDVPGGTTGAMQIEFRAGVFSDPVEIPVP